MDAKPNRQPASKRKRAGGGRKAGVAGVSAEAVGATPIPLRRVSKGKRPQFHDQVAVDQLFSIVTALAGELSAAFDRIDTLQRVLEANGGIETHSVETFQPDAEALEVRGAKREELIQRVFAVFETYDSSESG